MKLFFKVFSFFTIFFSISSCEDVIDVNVPSIEPRLVVDASINWEKGSLGNDQEIILSLSTDYFASDTFEPAIGAKVGIVNLSTNEVFNFTDNNNGSYTTSFFVPELNTSYGLSILYNNQTYYAEETFKSVTSIANINQTTDGGFDDSLTEVNIFFDDPIDEENYYLVKFSEPGDLLPNFITLKDEFTNGNQMTIFFEKDDDDDVDGDLIPGDIVDIELIGISKQYFNYMSLLLDQSEGQGPFATTPASINGNCINTTNTDKPAYGYFRLTEIDKKSYTVQ
jgi:hypothetical protein